MHGMKYGLNILKSMLVLALIILLGFSSCEKRAYRDAEKKNTIEGYGQFIKKYPDSKLRQSAEGHIAHLYFEQAFKKNTVQAYEDYLKRFPQTISGPIVIANLTVLVDPEIKRLGIEQMAKMSATIKTDLGNIKLKLLPENAPETCRNFIRLAKIHFYDSTQFNLLIPGVLVQGGSPQGDPKGGPGYTIKAEFNELPNIPGAVGMVREEHPDSAGSQFYICLRSMPERDGKYTVFGQVVEGLEVVEALSNLESSGPEAKPAPYQPVKPALIRTIEISQERP